MNPFVYVELHTPALARAKAFYSELFNWKIAAEKGPEFPYQMVDTQEGIGGGMTSFGSEAAPPHWLTYVQVDDVEAALKRAEKLGAKILQGKEEAGPGFSGIIADPTGAVLGLFQPAAKK